MTDRTFHELEHEAWTARAELYDSLFASISSQAIGDTLKSLGNLQGKWLLDVACGTGHLVAAASEQGAIAQGVDFAGTMIDVARRNHPTCDYQVAEAAHLPQPDARLDMVTCLFGLSHMEDPQAAVKEAFRVLRPGGLYAFTLWFGADDGNEYFQIVQHALSQSGAINAALPPQWTQLRIADPARCTALTQVAGFESPVFQRLNIASGSATTSALIDACETMSVRTKLILARQSQPVQEKIRQSIQAQLEARFELGSKKMAWPALLTIVRKPD